MLKDTDLMPFGKYKGKRMIDVPASYLLYLFDLDYCYGEVKDYIKDNEQVLRQEVLKQENEKTN